MTDHEVLELASRQYGSFSRRQVLDTGGNDDLIKQRLAARRWLSMAPGVYGLPGWPDTWLRSLWVAHLDVGPASVVSHEAAAALHGLASFGPARWCSRSAMVPISALARPQCTNRGIWSPITAATSRDSR